MADFIAAPRDFEKRIARWCALPAAQILAELEQFCALLHKWQPAQNLVSRETLAFFWERHVADSLQVMTLLHPGERVIFDLGSGGGFPALPMAIASKGAGRMFHLIESNKRKGAFLREVARKLALPVHVHSCRIEQFDSRETGQADVILARALADLSHLLAYCQPLLKPDGRALLHKGRDYVEEMHQAGTQWHFDVLETVSETDRDAVVLDISHLRRRSLNA